MSDPFQDPQWLAFVKRAEDDLVPALRASGATLSLAPKGEADIKFAVELGLSIMLDKPILVLLHPGQVIPEHLRRVADLVLEADLDSPTAGPLVAQAIKKITEEYPDA